MSAQSRYNLMKAKHEVLKQLPVCWYCGEETEMGDHATCSERCHTLLMESSNEAWCDYTSLDDLKELQEQRK